MTTEEVVKVGSVWASVQRVNSLTRIASFDVFEVAMVFGEGLFQESTPKRPICSCSCKQSSFLFLIFWLVITD